MGQDITAATERCRDYVIELRRHFRTWPELSTEEFKSQEKIMDELAKMGLEPRKIANTGVIADIIGKFPGRTIAVRADMDALALEDECGQLYQSKKPGVCHGCGHDGHMAMLLGIAQVLCDVRGEIAGTVRLLFQPSEERYPGGALAMIAGGALKGVDAIIAAHLWQPIPVGTLGISYGRMMAQPGGFVITIQGKGGHASMPHQAVDPIRVGMQISQAINSISGCNMDPMEPGVVAVTVFHAGTVRNVIPDTAEIKGLIRVFDSELFAGIHKRIEQIAKGICEAHGATYTFAGDISCPPVINNPAIAQLVKEAGIQALGEAGVQEVIPVLGAEDFSQYQQKVPGALMFIGAGNPEKGIVYPHHHPKFDIDEASLSHGVEIMVRTVMDYLSAPI